MRVLIQKVNQASVLVDEKLISEIGKGLLVFVGIKADDSEKDSDYLINKIFNLRIFEDENFKMNKSVLDLNLEILLVSQFTLYADCKKGNRPSFINAMPPTQAKEFYSNFIEQFRKKYPKIQDGIFGAYMKINLINDGPVTIILDS
ncbi:MAG: D-aminoacyl-tRNA deacylase [bacterium]